ncbi:hypothetical protein D3C87_1346690 [compost metagenome]
MTATPQPHISPQVTQNQSSAFPVTSLILGIASLLGFGFFAGIPAIIFGAIALKRKQPEHGMSLAGVITGSIGTFISLLLLVFLIILFTVGYNSGYFNESEPLPAYDGYSAPIENPRT